MVSKATLIKNPSGLHLRPAGILCKEALLYKAKISFRVRNVTANAKSVLSVWGPASNAARKWSLSVTARMRSRPLRP